MASTSKVALATGAASGMGLAVTRNLLAHGWRVCLCDLNPPPANQHDDVDKALADGSAFFQVADVAEYHSLAAVFAAAWARWGRLDFVFANAGIGEQEGYLMQLDSSPSPGSAPPPPNLRTLNINAGGAAHTAYLAVHYMRQNSPRGGKIVATASWSGTYALPPAMPVYISSKHAVVGLVRSLGPTLRDEGITVNCVCPGLVPTNLTGVLGERAPPRLVTPLETVVKAVDDFISGDEKMTGCVAELSGSKVYLREPPQFLDDTQREVLDYLERSTAELRQTFDKK